MKKLLAYILLTILLAQSTYTNASAQDVDAERIEYLEDGGYLIISISDTAPDMSGSIALFAATTTQEKTKTIRYYNDNDQEQWYVKVTGTFTYGNGSAKCTKSVVSAKSYNSLWVLSDKKASKSGNKATASVTAKLYRTFLHWFAIKTVNKSVTLTCSSTGKFS